MGLADLAGLSDEELAALSPHLTPGVRAVLTVEEGTIVALLDGVVTFAREHPVLAKVLRDEPELIGPFLVADHDELVGRITAAVAPLLAVAMDAGWLARRDAVVVADWLVRLTISLVLAPPSGSLPAFLGELLLPALTPPEVPR